MPELTRAELFAIADLFLMRARARGIVEYGEIYRLLNRKDDKDNTIFRGMEKALRLLSSDRSVLYDALLSLKKSKVPSNGFFDILENSLHFDWRKRVGKSHASLEEDEKRVLTREQRELAYAHAATLPQDYLTELLRSEEPHAVE